jgi:hypothetical protein
MAIRSNIIRAPKRRFYLYDNSAFKIQYFDTDNLYPNRQKLFLLGSGTALGCVETKAKFIRGKGFENPKIDKKKVNLKGEKFISIKRNVAHSYAANRGFCLHFNYNLLGEISEIRFIPWEFARIGIADSFGNVSKISVWDNWERNSNRKNTLLKPVEYDVFNPSPEVVLSQVEEAGGIDRYKGQILYFTEEGNNKYVTSSFDSVLDHLRVEASVGAFNANSAENNFTPSQIIGLPEQETEEAQNAVKKDIQAFQGTDNANSILVLWGVDDETKPFFQKVDQQNFDGRLKHTSEEARVSIMAKFGQTSALKGVPQPGKLGNSSEIENSFELYNTLTDEERQDFRGIWELINPYLSPSIRLSENNDFSIIPLSFRPSQNGINTNI